MSFITIHRPQGHSKSHRIVGSFRDGLASHIKSIRNVSTGHLRVSFVIPLRNRELRNPIIHFFNDELFGKKQERNSINAFIKNQLTRAIEDGIAQKVVLKGQAGRLIGYYHHGNQTVSKNEKKVVLFLHGSGSSAEEQSASIHCQYQNLGVDVLSINMRGYGESDGRPSEQGIYQDARTMFEYLVNHRGINPSNILIHGYSMGGPVAADLARYVALSGHSVSGVLLDRPMPSMTKAITAHGIPDPLGAIRGVSKYVNGRFSVEKNLKGLPKKIPIMLLTDCDGMGSEGEKLRIKLKASGYQVHGERTNYAHEDSSTLMKDYAHRIISNFF
ncbi:alpha/beta hydrolase [Vibrio parahaemolyticus]|nr:alpha/beta hydrolase [Vibrio parahaemolyticus]ELA7258648.1 alpha/beta hydrolase [Vibrio parahaemolyticus]EMF1842308.1 alpha/beta hydrolase [Vibrio parahaemolyticus]